ncbi:MAG: hypothetical protein NC914_01840 [Candidatus Omnitrophica bacterium]|nr:hypothetical protein [Candidatus Omnitrophota bacterium]
MREHSGFLRISSVVIKIAAWIFLLLGLVGGIAVLFGSVSGYPRWMGPIIIGLYTFIFFFLFLIAKISDLLVTIIKEIEKEEELIKEDIKTR